MGFLSDVVDSVFGGTIGEAVFGTDPSAENRVLETLTPEQRSLLQQIVTEARQQIGPSSAEEAITGGILEEVAGENALADTAEQRLTELISGTDEDASRLFEEAIAQPLREEFEQSILPSIRLQFGGNFSQGRAIATGEAGGTFADQLIRARAQFQLDQQQQQLQALGLVPSFQTGRLSALTAALQGVSGAEATRRVARQNLIAAALGTPAFENVVVSDPGRPGFLEAAAPGVGQAVTSSLLPV